MISKTVMHWALGLVLLVAIAVALAWHDRFDARSRSRLGRVDRGVNAKRIRAYLAALQERAAANKPQP